MPEYSGTTITPADGVQVPSMNGSTAGNILLSALKSYMLSGAGQANGLATLGSDGKLTAAQLPDLADDVIVVTTYANLPSPGTAAKIYITADTNKGYRWDPELTTPGYVKIFEMDKSIVFGYYSSGSFYEDSEHTVQITPVEHVFYVDVSLADIYVLNDGTLIELLGTKWAKITDIQDGTIQAGVAVKAFQDAMGRAIITTYETKADASDLKDAIDNNSQRIENLEVAVSGSLVQTNTDATMANTKVITNANSILPWAILKRVGARAVSWNQLCPKFTARTVVVGDVTWTIDEDGVVSATWSNTLSENSTFSIFGSSDAWGASIPQGHKFLVGNKPSNTATQIRFAFYDTDGNTLMDTGITNADSQRIFTLQNGTAVKLYYALRIVANTPAGTAKFYPQFFDLTAMNMESLTADQFRAKFPASYYPYTSNPSIIPLNPSAFKVVGFNKWDEETRTGYYGSNGEFVSYEWALANKNAIPTVPSTVYCMYSAIQQLDRICFYDASMNFISLVNASPNEYTKSFTTPSNCAYINFNLKSDYGITYLHNVCINISQSDTSKPLHDGVYEEYKETTLDTSFTSDYLYVNPSCHDYSENVLVDGVMRRKEHLVVGSVDLSTFAWSYNSGWNCWQIIAPSDMALPPSNSTKVNALHNSMIAVMASGYISGSVANTFAVNVSGTFFANTGSATVSPSGILFYELATPSTPTLHDPIPNIPCEDGTTVTAVTPQTDLVNAIDVPSTIAYMTKISS